MKSLLIIEDQVVLRETLAEYFMAKISGLKVYQAGSHQSALDLCDADLRPDLVLLDFKMPGGRGLEGLKQILKGYAESPVAIFSGAISESELNAAKSAGVAGFIPKSFNAKAVLDLSWRIFCEGTYFPPLSGEIAKNHNREENTRSVEFLPKLTERQRQVLDLIVDGKRNKEIALKLKISEATVKEHVSRIYDIFGVRSRIEVVAAAMRSQG